MKRLSLSVLLFLFISTGARAGEKMLELVYTENTDTCKSFSTRLYYRSQHAEGDRGGRLQQRNGGIGSSCYLNEGKNFYWMLAALENSQFGNTFGAGPGIRASTPQLWGFSLEARVEIPIVWYESPRRHTYVWGPLPIRSRGVTWKIPRLGYDRLGYLSLVEQTLGINEKERVRLYSLEWRKEF